MSEIKQLALLAEYNQLMNRRQYAAANKLTKNQLEEDKGAFFKSVLGTLNHILVGDIIWLKRFANYSLRFQSLSTICEMDKPSKLNALLFTDLDALRNMREGVDESIVNWVGALCEDELNECVTYTNISGRTFSKPLVSLIHHLFIHQVHHRGQITTLLCQYGIDFGDTDLIEIIDECRG